MNIFEQASRRKLRFDINGSLSVEQLWDLAVKRTRGNETEGRDLLIAYEAELTETVESFGKSTRRVKVDRSLEQENTQLRLNIVTHILNTVEEEDANASSAEGNRKHNQEILQLIADKKKAAMGTMSIEDLEKMLK